MIPGTATTSSPRTTRGRASLEPDAVVLAHGLDTAAEVDPRRAGRAPEQRLERARPSLREREKVLFRPGVELPEERDDLLADEAALGVRVGRVDPERHPDGPAVRLGLLAPDGQQRTHDAVLAPGLDTTGLAARDEPVEDGLDLVGRGVAGRPQTVGGEGVAQVAEIGLGRCGWRVDDFGTEHLRAEPRVVFGLCPAKRVVDVQRGDVVAELA